jgi:predicted ATPase
MLTRLKVSGFKNLSNVDIRFGAFTCIAGANGVGKSNLFDAIRFLSATADRPLLDAALQIRDEGRQGTDVRNLFLHLGDKYQDKMIFEAEMIIPKSGFDDLGQEAHATSTFVIYKLELGYRKPIGGQSPLEILHESLEHITKSDAVKHLLFTHSAEWREDIIKNERRGSGFISTIHDENNQVKILQHQDGGNSGKPQRRLAKNLPRTILSVSNATENPTALLARRELQSWQLLQLEPSVLRQSSNFTSPVILSSTGENLAATLYNLAHRYDNSDIDIYAQVANQLAELIEDIRTIDVISDERRELFTIQVTDQYGTQHSAKALSDGTLRFLALSVLNLSMGDNFLLCLEEPENGIHPSRIPAILELLQQIASDPQAKEIDTQLQQIIINTHSPSVVQQVPNESVIFVDKLENNARFRCLTNTWRSKEMDNAPLGDLLPYISPVMMNSDSAPHELNRRKSLRTIDRSDVRQLVLPWVTAENE